jgi:hypothetical protein
MTMMHNMVVPKNRILTLAFAGIASTLSRYCLGGCNKRTAVPNNHLEQKEPADLSKPNVVKARVDKDRI